MNTRLLVVAGSSALILGGTLMYQQSTKISKQSNQINELSDENVGLKTDLTKEISLSEALSQENTTLKEKILELTSTIDNMTIELIKLRKDLKIYKGKVSRREKKIADYKKQITELSRNRDANRLTINKLEAEKKKVMEDVEKLKVLLGKKKTKVTETMGQKMQEEIERINLKRIASITDGTMVEFKKFTVAKKRKGNVMKDIKPGTDKWKYTMIELNLDHEKFGTIMEKEFLVQIYDLDNNKPLSINNKENKFPDSQGNKLGARFKYDGNMVYIPYFNEEVKKGNNYEIRTYFVDADDKKHLIKKGVISLVRNGVPLSL